MLADLLLAFVCACGYVIVMTAFAFGFRKHFEEHHMVGDQHLGLSDGGVVALAFIWPISGAVCAVLGVFTVIGWVIGEYVRFIGRAK
jgi:ABC-type uncharacterized transport system permease subunit